MVILGAKGHAKELIDLLEKNNFQEDIILFDNQSTDLPELVFNTFRIIRSFDALQKEFMVNPEFIIGVGNPYVREKLCNEAERLGGRLCSVFSNTASIGSYEVEIGDGANIMFDVRITNSVKIGKACLINSKAMIHHDVEVGDFCEIGPCTCITGSVKIGKYCSIGAGAVILPQLEIGDNSVVGAGAIVTQNFKEKSTLVGIPAKQIQK